ncbi:MAG: radical SAM protein, partial [Desulfobacteraceae bacterium]|nr:radical SAM protein [Desulfobacteraceae bacterium]
PHYIRSRPFTPRPGTSLYKKASRNELERLTSKEQLLEIKQTIKSQDVTSKICFDHAGNHWTAPNGRLLLSQSYEGYKFPEEKKSLLALIEKQLKGD